MNLSNKEKNRKTKILIVDDQEEMRDLYSTIIRRIDKFDIDIQCPDCPLLGLTRRGWIATRIDEALYRSKLFGQGCCHHARRRLFRGWPLRQIDFQPVPILCASIAPQSPGEQLAPVAGADSAVEDSEIVSRAPGFPLSGRQTQIVLLNQPGP